MIFAIIYLILDFTVIVIEQIEGVVFESYSKYFNITNALIAVGIISICWRLDKKK